MGFTVIQGAIAAQRANALVNAAGTSPRMDSGVAEALRRGADGPIDDEYETIRGVTAGFEEYVA